MRIDVLVHGTIVASQESQHGRTTLGRELTVKYDYHGRLSRLLLLLTEAPFDERLFRVDIMSAAYVTSLEFVWVSRVEYEESRDRVLEVSVKERAESVGRDRVEIGVFGRVSRQGWECVVTRLISD